LQRYSDSISGSELIEGRKKFLRRIGIWDCTLPCSVHLSLLRPRAANPVSGRVPIRGSSLLEVGKLSFFTGIVTKVVILDLCRLRSGHRELLRVIKPTLHRAIIRLDLRGTEDLLRFLRPRLCGVCTQAVVSLLQVHCCSERPYQIRFPFQDGSNLPGVGFKV
jgi:hypothetical protein